MKLYKLNPEEKQIFQLAQKGDFDLFCNYYLKGQGTGTWWFPGRESPQWAAGYNKLLSHWRRKGKPDEFEVVGQAYRVHLDIEESAAYPNMPVFHYNHGMMMLPKGKEVANSPQREQWLLGGYGSGKSENLTIFMLICLAIYDDFLPIVLAPERKQARVIYDKALSIISGTLYEERFFVNSVQSPNEKIEVANDWVSTGQTNKLICYPLENPSTFKNMTLDVAIIEQAEMFPDHNSITEMIGSRMRGRTVKTGRPRMGRIYYIANSEDNQSMWDHIDKEQDDPKRYKVHLFSSYDNPYLSDLDIKNMEKDVGGTPDLIKVKMQGARPMGDGKKFSRSTLEQMQDIGLDEENRQGMALGLPGYVNKRLPGIGCYEWGIPYKQDHVYCVIADPGSDNPPKRDAYGIMVWDVTQFPGSRTNPQKATMAHFVWGFGGGKTDTWAFHFARLVNYYRAQMSNGFDATGFQSGYDQWLHVLSGLYPEKINLGSSGKSDCIVSGRMLADRGLMSAPKDIPGFYGQMSRYDYPERTKNDRQDLVITFCMSAWYLRRAFYAQLTGPSDEAVMPFDNWSRARYENPLPRDSSPLAR